MRETPRPILALLFISVAVSLVALSPKPLSEEEAAIKEVAQLYIDGAKSGNADLFNQAFYVDVADMKSVRTDRDTGNQYVSSVPITEAIHATIELLWAGNMYIDVMSMYKVNGEWKIVNKTFVNRGAPKDTEG